MNWTMIQSVIARLKSWRDAPVGSPLARYLEFVDSRTWPTSRAVRPGVWSTREPIAIARDADGIWKPISVHLGRRAKVCVEMTPRGDLVAHLNDGSTVPSAVELERTKERELARLIATRTSIDYAPTPPPGHCYAEGTMHPKAECERDSETIVSLGREVPTMIVHGPWRVSRS